MQAYAEEARGQLPHMNGKGGDCWNIANYVAAIVKEDGCNGGLLVAANNHCLISKFGKFGSHHC